MGQLEMCWESWEKAREAETIGGRFLAFHAKHPEIYAELRRMALVKLSEGRRRYGVKRLVEEIRFERRGGGTAPEFKIDNRFSSRYARKLIEDEPRLGEMFETRVLKTK